jgi:hypothetical protein
MNQTGLKVQVLKNLCTCAGQADQVPVVPQLPAQDLWWNVTRQVCPAAQPLLPGGSHRSLFTPAVSTGSKKIVIVSLRCPLLPGRDFNLFRQKILNIPRAVLIWTGPVRSVRNV